MKKALLHKDICNWAAELGFQAAGFLPPSPEDNAPEGCQTLIVLVRAYQPGGMLIDRYYLASNKAYHQMKQLSDRLRRHGAEVFDVPGARFKKLCRRLPGFAQGKNTLNYLPPFGSRFCMELIGCSGVVGESAAIDHCLYLLDRNLNCDNAAEIELDHSIVLTDQNSISEDSDKIETDHSIYNIDRYTITIIPNDSVLDHSTYITNQCINGQLSPLSPLDQSIDAIDHSISIKNDCGDKNGLADPCTACNRCANACPTGAITANGFDMTRCVRFHMLRNHPMPEEFRPFVGVPGGCKAIIGCDICQSVCPMNSEMQKRERLSDEGFTLAELLACDKAVYARFAEECGPNCASRSKIQAQAALAAGNSGDKRYLPMLEKLARHPSAPVSEHAAWAIRRICNLRCGN